MSAIRSVAIFAALVVSAALPAEAQTGFLRTLDASAGPTVYFVRQGSDVDANSRSGTWAGAEAAVRAGRIHVQVRVLFGSLGGSSAGLGQRVRETGLGVSLALRPWLDLGVDVEALRLASDLATTLWRLYGVRGAVSQPLGVRGLTGRAEFAVYPITGVVAARQLRRPMRAEVGVSYATPLLPLAIGLGYRVESIDFEDTNDLRLAGLLLGVTVRRGR